MSQKGQGNHLSKMIMMTTKHLAGTSGTSSPAPPYCFASSHTFAVAKNLLATAAKFVATAAKFRRRGGKFRRRGGEFRRRRGITPAVAALLHHGPAYGLRLRVPCAYDIVFSVKHAMDYHALSCLSTPTHCS